MKKTQAAVALALLVCAAGARAQVQDIFGPVPTQPRQTGSPEVQRNLTVTGDPLYAKRLGIISYCGDLSPIAGDFGQFGRREWFESRNPIWQGDPTPTGWFGAQNLVDMFNYDDTIPRFREVQLIDGDREQPTSAQLVNNFDCVVAITDNKCAPGSQAAIYTQAGTALAGFAGTTGKGVVLAGMAFNTTTGIGSAMFTNQLSPFTKSSTALDTRCGPNQPCPIGSCPAGSVRMIANGVTAPECFSCSSGVAPSPDPANPGQFTCPAGDGFVFNNPVFTPVTKTNDFVCEGLLKNVNGPTSSSFASAFTGTGLSPQGTACLNYENGIPLLAVNNRRNVIGLNLMPTYAPDLLKTWFSCIVANAAILACGEKRCVADNTQPGGYRCN
jgi:hypothetical protein